MQLFSPSCYQHGLTSRYSRLHCTYGHWPFGHAHAHCTPQSVIRLLRGAMRRPPRDLSKKKTFPPHRSPFNSLLGKKTNMDGRFMSTGSALKHARRKLTLERRTGENCKYYHPSRRKNTVSSTYWKCFHKLASQLDFLADIPYLGCTWLLFQKLNSREFWAFGCMQDCTNFAEEFPILPLLCSVSLCPTKLSYEIPFPK